MRLAIATCAVLLMAGCCEQKTKPITLSTAVSGLRQEMKAIKSECDTYPDQCKNGQYLSEVTVALAVGNVTEKDFSVEIPIGGLTVTPTSKVTDSTTNTITLKFSSPLFASKDAGINACFDTAKKRYDVDCLKQAGAIPMSPAAPGQ